MFSELTSLLSLEALKKNCNIKGTNFFSPHSTQSLHFIPSLIQAFFSNSLKQSEKLILLGLDGISYDVASSNWSPDAIYPLTSTFPSTSSVAWLTAMTGLKVNEHNLPGAVYYQEKMQTLFNCLTDQALLVNSPHNTYLWENQSIETHLKWPTVFNTLRGLGIRCLANIGDLVNWPSHWADSIIDGAEIIKLHTDWAAVRYYPIDIVEVIKNEMNEIKDVLMYQNRVFMWSFVNFDDYIHLNGYSKQLKHALETLQSVILEWVNEGYTVIAHSDHGMTKNEVNQQLIETWDNLNSLKYCSFPPGGAGRTRWAYAKPANKKSLLKDIRELLRKDAMVIEVDELESLGILKLNDTLRARIGNIIAIANGTSFPTPELNYPYNHGSLTYEEMFIPLAIWLGR